MPRKGYRRLRLACRAVAFRRVRRRDQLPTTSRARCPAGADRARARPVARRRAEPPAPADERAKPVEQGAPVATGSGPLSTATIVELLDVDRGRGDGREIRQFIPADRIRAGDEVYYTIRVQQPRARARRQRRRHEATTLRYALRTRLRRRAGGRDRSSRSTAGESFGPPADLQVHATGQPAAGPGSRITRTSAGACGRRLRRARRRCCGSGRR